MAIEISSDYTYYNSVTKTVNRSTIPISKDNENAIPAYNTDAYLPNSLSTNNYTYSKTASICDDSIKTALQKDVNEDFNLPAKFDLLKDTYIFYKGQRTSEYDFIKEAVKTGRIELTEGESLGSACYKATKALIHDTAKPLYKWSSTVYSEDGSYIMRIGKDGKIDGFTYAGSANGKLTKDIAAKVASGGALDSEDLEDCKFLRDMDPELFTAAVRIRHVKVSFKLLSGLYDEGRLTAKLFYNLCSPIYKMFFGDNGGEPQKMVGKLKELFNMDPKEFGKYALENYKPF